MGFPKTEPPPDFVEGIVEVFRRHESQIATLLLAKGLTSDQVLGVLRDDLVGLGFQVESSKKHDEKIHRPVFFGEDGVPTLKYEIDAYHTEWRCGLEVEAGRAIMGGAVYRDLVQALVMVGVETLILAVSNEYKHFSQGRQTSAKDYDMTVRVADTLYQQRRFQLPYRLVVVGY
jgi:hypothetical protein